MLWCLSSASSGLALNLPYRTNLNVRYITNEKRQTSFVYWHVPAWILLFLASCSIVYGASIKASIHENSGPLKAAIGGALDLGETKKGSDLKFGIELRNASSEHPITITGIHPDCGCTQVIEVSTLDLAPAATGSVAFTWHVEGNPKTEARRRIQFVYLYDKELIATVVEVRVRITE